MHCLGASCCGLRGHGCNLWPMGESVALVALVLPCGLLVCNRTAAYSTSLALRCRFETGNRPADGCWSLQGLPIVLRSRGSQPPSVLPEAIPKRKPCKTRRMRRKSNRPQGQPESRKTKTCATRDGRDACKAPWGGKGRDRGHAKVRNWFHAKITNCFQLFV